MMPYVLGGVIGLLLFSSPLAACSIPVFRYALDRWAGDAYLLHTAPARILPAALAKELETLEHDGYANVVIEAQDNLAADAAELVFPRVPGGSAWSGRLNSDGLKCLLDSPARQEMCRRLTAGDSGIWVLIEGHDKGDNDRAFAVIEKTCRLVEKGAVLPEVDPADTTAAVGPGPELAVRLSTLRLSRMDTREAATVAMLEGSQEDIKGNREAPMACLVFGRAHVLATFTKDDLSENNIADASGFLFTDCSCQIKDMHPGWDLLVDFDWDGELAKADAKRQNASATTVPTTNPATRQTMPAPETVVIPDLPSVKQPVIRTISPKRYGAAAMIAFGLAGLGLLGWHRMRSKR